MTREKFDTLLLKWMEIPPTTPWTQEMRRSHGKLMRMLSTLVGESILDQYEL
jgi:hypothetical protein